MRIAIDVQGIQSSGSRQRGIGRYSLAITKEIINNYPNHHFVLVSNSLLSDISHEFSFELNNLSNVEYFRWISPAPLSYVSKNNTNIALGTYLRSYAFSRLYVDAILITSFLEGFNDNCLTELDFDFLNVPVFCIFYDLIPLLKPDLYLNNNPDFSKYYHKKVKKFRSFTALLAISNSSKNEAVKFLNFDSNNVYNISSACDTKLFNNFDLDNNKSDINIDNIVPYILYTGASDPRKNVVNLIHAYSLLNSQLLKTYKLVLAGKLLEPEIQQIYQWIEIYNLNPSNVHVLGYISDSDLVMLYKNCSLFVFPSLHEGFGLPVLEAMTCGAPVIGSYSTSIPEIVGTKKALFNPNNVIEIKNLIERSLVDRSFNSFLISNSVNQAKLFSWSNTASLLIQSLEKYFSNLNLKQSASTWEILNENNKRKFQHLINTIQSSRILNKNSSINMIQQISSSIELINYELDQINRSMFTSTNINSWRIEGPFDSNYSLAILNRNLAKALSRVVKNIFIHNTEGFGDYKANSDFIKLDPEIYEIYKASLDDKSSCQIVSRNLYPPRVNDLSAQLNLLHSYGWEESEFPSNWVHDFNFNLQGISVMSRQVKKILIDNGVKIPIHITGLGLDHLISIEKDVNYKVNAKKFKFLHISSCFPRKSVDVLLKSYEHSFNKNDDVTLVIKTFNNPHNNIAELLEKLQCKNHLFPDVLVINEELSDDQLKSLYLQCNVFVAPSRGEGFGLPIGEAMQLGIPVITTSWGGQLDFCNSSNSWLIDYKFEMASTHFDLDMSYWAEPSYLHLSKIMKYFVSDNTKEINKRINTAKSSIAKFKWDQVAINNLNFANSLLKKSSNKGIRIGWVTTWFTNCGIAAYSKHLIEYMNEDIIIFSPLSETRNHDQKNLFPVKPSWNLESDGLDNYDLLYEKIKLSSINTIIIQFNYNFFDFSEFSKLIFRLTHDGIQISIFLHSTTDPKNSDKKLVNLLSAFKKCKRIFVHTISDLNNMKNIGLIDNVILFPHGVPEFNQNDYKQSFFYRSLSRTKSFKISTFGFCLPNKGFDELIKAIRILKDRNIRLSLNMYTAIYSNEYKYVFDDLQKLIKELSVEDIVTLNGDFISEKNSLRLLSYSDLIVFPYQHSNESSSASVRQALAVNKPVVVTPLDIFNDVSSFVDYFRGFSSNEMAEDLYKISINQKKLTHASEMNYTNEVIKKRRFPVLSSRLSAIIHSLIINDN